MRAICGARLPVLVCLASSPVFAANAKYHADATSQAMEDAGFAEAPRTIATVANLTIGVYSALPEALQPFTQGPWACEAAPFEACDLFTADDVRGWHTALQSTAEQAVKRIASDIQANKCSAAGCDGHAGAADRCHEWNDPAEKLLPDRQTLLLHTMGAVLHAAQNFYYRSNWVELWDEAGKGDDIPAWNDVVKPGFAQGVQIIGGTSTARGRADNPPEGAPSYGDSNKDSPASPEGRKRAGDGKTTYHELAKRVARKATDQWLARFEEWVDDDAVWNGLKSCPDLPPTLSRSYTAELDQLRNIFKAVNRWDGDEGAGGPSAADALKQWDDRSASVSKQVVRDLLRGFVDNDPAREYLAAGPAPARTELPTVDETGADLRGLTDDLKAAQKGAEGQTRDLITRAAGAAQDALEALDAANPTSAFLHTSQARSQVRAAKAAAAQQKAAEDVVAALNEAEIAVGEVVASVARTPKDVEIWTPGEVAEGEVWTGLVTVETPAGYQPYEGDIVVNGEVVPVEKGRFEGPRLTALGPTVLFFGIRELIGDDRKISPEIDVLPAPEPGPPLIATNSTFVHPREPMLTMSGEGLTQLTSTNLVNAEGKTINLPITAGSTYEQICLTPPSISVGTYTLSGQTAAGETIEAPDAVTVPSFTAKTTPVTEVGQKGQVTVTSTCPEPMSVEILGGEPQIRLHESVVEVSQEAPGVVGFTATQAGAYTIMICPRAPERPDIEAVPLPEEQSGEWFGTVVDGIVERGGPDVFVADPAQPAGYAWPWLDGGVLYDLGDISMKGLKKVNESKRLKKAKKYEDEAKKREKEAEKLEKAAKAAEEKAKKAKGKEKARLEQEARKKREEAAKKRKEAGDLRKKAGDEYRRAGDSEKAAENYEDAADNYRKEAADTEAVKGAESAHSAHKRAAEAAKKAAETHRREAGKHAKEAKKHEKEAKKHEEAAKKADEKGDKKKAEQERKKAEEERKKAAGEYDKAVEESGNAADDYDKAGKDYDNAGRKIPGRTQRNAAERARNLGSGYSAKAEGLRRGN